MSTEPGGTGPDTPQPEQAEVPASRLLATLGVAGVVAGLIIVMVFRGTQPRIQAYKDRMLQEAVQEVLKGPSTYDTLFVRDGRLTEELPEGSDPRAHQQVYRGFAEDGDLMGYAMAAGEPGFQDIVRIIFGFDPSESRLMGMKVLESKETPGLGDKIEKDQEFVSQFDGALVPIEGVKSGAGEGGAHEIDMITGATISSRTVIRIINNTLDRLGPMFEQYAAGGAR